MDELSSMIRNKLVEDQTCEIVEFHFLDSSFLSPVRDQGMVHACAHVSVVEAMEMVYRISGYRLNDSSLFYFDVNELFDHAHMASSNFLEAEVKAEVIGDSGTDMSTVMSFVIQYGLNLTRICMNPRPRNLHARLDGQVKRYSVELTPREVFGYAMSQPVSTGLIPYRSFCLMRQAIYQGPMWKEIGRKHLITPLHAVLIVGFSKIRRGNKVEYYATIQNSHISMFGISGFALVPFDYQDLFTHFWTPIDIRDPKPQGLTKV